MGKIKKIGISIAVVIGFLVVMAAIGYSLSPSIKENDNQPKIEQSSEITIPKTEKKETKSTVSPQPTTVPSTPITPSNPKESLFTGPIEDLLPDREDLGTMWQIEYTSRMQQGSEQQSSTFEEVRNSTG